MAVDESEVQSHACEAVSIEGVDYAFPGCAPCLENVCASITRGARCLLIGCNGAGKTTLLKVIAGQLKVPMDKVAVVGSAPFYDLQLASSGRLAFLGHQWRRAVASAATDLPIQGDLAAGDLIHNVAGVDPDRRAQLMQLLDINPSWRMHQVSDGQRRRVQVCMGLLKPYEILLLDEITVDMDVLGRLDLLRFFKRECEQRGCTILYATHIFDGLTDWMTHLLFLSDGNVAKAGPVDAFPDLKDRKLLHVVSDWLRSERDRLRLKPKVAAVQPPQRPMFVSRHMSHFR